MKCPAILDSAYIISRKDHHFGVQVNYTCIDKFTFPNTTKKTYKLSRCQYDGQWTPKLAECIRMYLRLSLMCDSLSRLIVWISFLDNIFSFYSVLQLIMTCGSGPPQKVSQWFSLLTFLGALLHSNSTSHQVNFSLLHISLFRPIYI